MNEQLELTPQRLLARKRWQLLGNILCKRRISRNGAGISVRRFSSFGLLQATVLQLESPEGGGVLSHAADDGNNSCHIWYLYRSIICKEFMAEIRHLDRTIDLKDILGFNNTGNVCVWPSEEVLTYYCLKYMDMFRNKAICEIGGGMTCLAGVALSLCTEMKEMLLTDGNDNSINNVEVIVRRNNHRFKTNNVQSRVLRWDKHEQLGALEERFDTIIFADCFFFDEFHEDLVTILHKMLKPGGEVISFAPSRGTTFVEFIDLAKTKFAQVTNVVNYDEDIWNLHKKNIEKGIEEYDANIHYPMLLHLVK